MAYDEFHRIKLLKEEEEEIANLPKNYYRVKEDNENYDYIASRRLVISKEWGKRLLIISLVMNVITSLLVVSCVLILLFKPTPDYYGTTPSGMVYPLKQLK